MTKYILPILLLTVTACNKNSFEDSGAQTETFDDGIIRITNQQFTSSDYEIGAMNLQTFEQNIRVSGEVHLHNKHRAVVSTPIAGHVAGMNYIRGQWIKKGQPLFRVSTPELFDLQQKYILDLDRMESLQIEYRRLQLLEDQQMGVAKEILVTEAAISALDKSTVITKKKLDNYGIKTDAISAQNVNDQLDIHAPISGYIDEINIVNGAYIERNRAAISIANIHQLHIELKVLESDIDRIQIGDIINFWTQGNDERMRQGKIYLIQPEVDNERLVTVHCHALDGSDKSLLPGMSIVAKIRAETEELLSLPQEGVVKSNSNYYVLELIKNDDQGYSFRQKKVDVLAQNAEHYAVSGKDISEGSNFLIKGAYFIATRE